jgi:hypothetical protein
MSIKDVIVVLIEILIGQRAQLVEDRSDVHPIIGVGKASIADPATGIVIRIGREVDAALRPLELTSE